MHSNKHAVSYYSLESEDKDEVEQGHRGEQKVSHSRPEDRDTVDVTWAPRRRW